MFRGTDPQTTLGALDILPSPKKIGGLERSHWSRFLRENRNLRSIRQAELEDNRPTHVICAWMGNSRAVAQKHYLQVTDDHFDRAALPSEAVRNPLQQPAAGRRTGSHAVEADFRKPLDCKALRDHATSCDDGEICGVGDTGLEPVDTSYKQPLWQLERCLLNNKSQKRLLMIRATQKSCAKLVPHSLNASI